MIFNGRQIVNELVSAGITHVIWVPDSSLGPWESDIEASERLTLLRVCREGETWPLAAGLMLGGQFPVVIMQTTGLFESGDALRNVVHDLKMPIVAIIGARNWLNPEIQDSARDFAKPILDAWQIDYAVIDSPSKQPQLAMQIRLSQDTGKAAIILIAE